MCQKVDNHPEIKQNAWWKLPERLFRDCWERKQGKSVQYRLIGDNETRLF